jgi:hypothetical protein
VAKKHTNDFDDVLEYELDQVAKRRREITPYPAGGATSPSKRKRAMRMNLVGLALSGGGIRSATFSLGILQALAKLKLLTRIDYLSTVSGGGYIGGWLAAWVRREIDNSNLADPVHNVQREMAPDRCTEARAERWDVNLADQTEPRQTHDSLDAEPEPIHHLRAHSRYLSPRHGIFTPDTWTLFSIYFRNLFINSLVLFPVVAVFVLAARLLIYLFTVSEIPDSQAWPLFWAFVLLLVVSQVFVRIALNRIRATRARATTGPTEETPRAAEGWQSRVSRFVSEGRSGGVVLILFSWVLLAAATLGLWLNAPDPAAAEQRQAAIVHSVIWVWTSPRSTLPECVLAHFILQSPHSRMPGPTREWKPRVEKPAGLTEPCNITDLWWWLRHWIEYWDIGEYGRNALLFGGIGLFAGVVSWWWNRFSLRRGLWYTFVTIVFGVVFGVLLTVVIDHFLYYDNRSHPVRFATFGPPLFILALLVGGYVEVAIAGGAVNEYEREWRSRIGALFLMHCVGWVAVFVTVAYLPGWLTDPTNWAVAISAWAAVSAVGAKLLPWLAKVSPGRLFNVLANIVPLVFLIGLLAMASLVVNYLPGLHAGTDFSAGLTQAKGCVTAAYLAVALIVAVGMMCLVPANRFSLHALYGNRLTRAYLGASLRPPSRQQDRGAPTGATELRSANDFTGFDPNDDLALAQLRVSDLPDSRKPYLGPYPLINTTLNLVGGAELAYQDRKGESFFLTPAYCGSHSTGYAFLNAQTRNDGADPADLTGPYWNLTLGRAITISGAAVDPNMNVLQSPQLTALLTVLNARLGWWMTNPKRSTNTAQPWDADPPWGALPYLWELLGETRADNKYVHLSDGGHFENSGVYELLRRRCRYIIQIDAAEDVEDASENLANLVRLAFTDLGIPIEIDTSPVREGPDGLTRCHCAVGAIRYDDVDPDGVVGTLIFIRAGLSGDEPADIRNYAINNPPFPHQSTLNQFFDEAQFESYRGLGFHIGMSVFAEAAREVSPADTSAGGQLPFNRRFFSAVRRQWLPVPAQSREHYLASCRDYMRLAGGLLSNDNLARLGFDVFPELQTMFHQAAPQPNTHLAAFPAEADLFTVASLIQLMEMVWLENDLDRYHSYPANRGWMNMFRRWTAAAEFRKYWPVVRCEYSRGFVRFCEKALNLDELPVQWFRVENLDDDPWKQYLSDLDAEFFAEWGTFLARQCDPQMCQPDEYLRTACSRSAPVANDSRPAVWALTTGRPATREGSLPNWDTTAHPLGLVVVFDPILDAEWQSQEFLVWVRGAYRSAGIASASVPRILHELSALLPSEVPLMSRYPRIGTVHADRVQRALWLTFMNDNDFEIVPPNEQPWAAAEVRVLRE